MPRRPRATLRQIGTSFGQAFLSLMMPIIILGGIGLGVVTPTESGAIAVGYAILLGLVYKEIKRENIHSILVESVTVTCSVMFIIAAATLFSWLLVSQNIPQKATELILSITHNKWMVLLLLNIVLLIMGCFLDTMAILITVTPVFVPLVTALNIDLVHFGVVLGLNLMIGALTPPMGILFYIVSDVGRVPVEKVIKELWPFLFPLGIVLGIITYFPTVVTWLPTLIFK
jgi:tripartite ATP-independent transporter DctM subunit